MQIAGFKRATRRAFRFYRRLMPGSVDCLALCRGMQAVGVDAYPKASELKLTFKRLKVKWSVYLSGHVWSGHTSSDRKIKSFKNRLGKV
jgi:hypothetical protein